MFVTQFCGYFSTSTLRVNGIAFTLLVHFYVATEYLSMD